MWENAPFKKNKYESFSRETCSFQYIKELNMEYMILTILIIFHNSKYGTISEQPFLVHGTP